MNPEPAPSQNTWLGRYADFVLRWRLPIIAVALVAVAILSLGAKNLGFNTNYRGFFSGENPELTAFEEFQGTYTKTDNILFVVQPKNGDVFSPEMAQAIEDLTTKAWQLPFASRVDSVSNFQHTWADEDDLTVEDLIVDGSSLTEKQLAAKREVALAEPLLKDNLLSADSDTTGINVTFQFPEKDLMEVPNTAAKARKISDELLADHPDLTIALSGLTMLNNAFAEETMGDMATLVPLMYLLLLVVMVIVIRSFSGTIATLLVIMMATAAAMGIGGYANIKLLPISALAPTIILTLAIADSIHVLTSMRKNMADGLGKRDAIRESIRINFLPVTITSFTTIIGFLALNFSDSPPFWHLGNLTAVGIATAWALSLAFLPALASLLPFRAPQPKPGRRDLFDRYSTFLVRYHRPVLFGSAIIAVGLALMAPRNEINDEWVKYFDHRVEFRGDAEFGMEHLTGVYALEYSIDSGEPNGISDPAYLDHLEKFTTWLRGQPEVEHVYSYADIMKRLNKNMHGDDPAYYKLPHQADLAAQYQLLYEISLPFGLDLNDRVSIDKAATRLTVLLPELSTNRVQEFTKRADTWLRDHAPPSFHEKPTGPTTMFAHIAERNIDSMLTGNALAIGLIAIVMIVALRSWKLGLLSIIPNSLPILITFGIWALLVGRIGLAAATVTATSLGIIVDDTVHFLAKFLHARRELKMSKESAVRYAFNTVGGAIVATTIILALGFALLAYSTFLINSHMGLLTAIAIVVAFVFDFTILPALLLLTLKPQPAIESNQNHDHEHEPVPTPA